MSNQIKSAEEILDKFLSNWFHNTSIEHNGETQAFRNQILRAMNDYASQFQGGEDAIGWISVKDVVKFIGDFPKDVTIAEDEYYFIDLATGKEITEEKIERLFTKYLNDKSK